MMGANRPVDFGGLDCPGCGMNAVHDPDCTFGWGSSKPMVKPETDPNGFSAKTPGAKLDAGKPRPALIMRDMPRAMLAIAAVGTYGADKYSESGWLQVPNGESRYGDAMLRHMLGEAIEEFDESGLRHAAQVAWNAMARLELLLRRKEQENGQKKSN